MSEYDPFAAGPFAVDERTFTLHDPARERDFAVAVWSPAETGSHPLIVYSHHSGGNRRVAALLCGHLASHGYEVAAMDHSEVAAREQLPAERSARLDAIIAGRVPDIRLLIDHFGREEVGLVGHSFGGWAVLATPEVDDRVGSVVAMGPGGSESPRPGILPVRLTFRWRRSIPTLYLAAENDVPIPLAGVYEIFDRAPQPKRLLVLRRADHQHFLDDIEGAHEAARNATFPPEAAWIPAAMVPIGELTQAEQAHDFVHGLPVAHLDATLRRSEAGQQFLDGAVVGALAARGVDATQPSRSRSTRR